MASIIKLHEEYKKLSPTAKKRFDAIFTFSLNEGRLHVPEGMKPWAIKQFGSISKLEHQPILKIVNQITYEGTLFNKLRAERPIHNDFKINKKELLRRANSEPFSDVEKKTPEDTFGRVYGRSEVTASNIAKYDALHGLVIFNKADPIAFTEEELIDHFDTALSWIAVAHQEYPEAQYPVIGWNCLWKSSASLVHGHLQVLLSKEPYGAHLLLKRMSEQYLRKEKRNYWNDLFLVHESLGLGKELKKGSNVRVFANLTPRKEKEIVLLADKPDEHLFSALYRVLDIYRNLGVESFNVGLFLQPIKEGNKKKSGKVHKKNSPVMVRVVDRGSLSTSTSDIGVMELYFNQSVVSSDPFKLWKEVKKAFKNL